MSVPKDVIIKFSDVTLVRDVTWPIYCQVFLNQAYEVTEGFILNSVEVLAYKLRSEQVLLLPFFQIDEKL